MTTDRAGAGLGPCGRLPRSSPSAEKPLQPTVGQDPPGCTVPTAQCEIRFIVGIAVFSHFFVRGLVDGRQRVAFDHADLVVAAERWLGVFIEPGLQS